MIIRTKSIKINFVYYSINKENKRKVMSKFRELRLNAPKLAIKEGAREVIFKTISCMCDNVGHLRFRKNSDGDFKLDGNGFAVSNWQMKHEKHEIEWEADENMWGGVIAMINSGTAAIESVISR